MRATITILGSRLILNLRGQIQRRENFLRGGRQVGGIDNLDVPPPFPIIRRRGRPQQSLTFLEDTQATNSDFFLHTLPLANANGVAVSYVTENAGATVSSLGESRETDRDEIELSPVCIHNGQPP